MKKRLMFLVLISALGFSQKSKAKKNKLPIIKPIVCTFSGHLWEDDIKKFQYDLNAEYYNPKESPLRGEQFKKFKGHPFFPLDHQYYLVAKLVKTENAIPFDIPTSSGKSKKYKVYGKLYFNLNGLSQTLTVYQNLSLMEKPEYKNYLFLPFRDATNGKETYGGGRYLDLRIPIAGDDVVIDFNKAYHPYCAYNAFDYNCPIVPEENWLTIPIKAGVKYEDIWFQH